MADFFLSWRDDSFDSGSADKGEVDKSSPVDSKAEENKVDVASSVAKDPLEEDPKLNETTETTESSGTENVYSDEDVNSDSTPQETSEKTVDTDSDSPLDNQEEEEQQEKHQVEQEEIEELEELAMKTPAGTLSGDDLLQESIMDIGVAPTQKRLDSPRCQRHRSSSNDGPRL